MRVSVLFVALVLALLVASAAGKKEKRVAMETTRSDKLFGWYAAGRADPSTLLKIIVAPKLRNLDALDSIFWAVSDPKHVNYGKHMSRQEVSHLVSPAPEDVAVIEKWLADHHITVDDMHMGGDFLFAHATVEQLEQMLEAEFLVYKHGSGAELVRSHTGYTVPAKIAARIDFITGIVGLPLVKGHVNVNPVDVGSGNIGPANLRARYNVTDLGVSTVNNSQAVAEFQAQFYSPADLVTFFTKYVSNSNEDTVTKVVGKNNPKVTGTEAELDIEYIMGVAPDVPTWFYSFPQNDFWTGLVEYFSAVGNDSTAPPVHSISYGDQQESQPSEDYKQRLAVETQKLGVMGHSIIIASGDSGTGCDACSTFQASFPSTLPYVTAVGATRFITGTSGPEAAVNNFASGGGFSRTFTAPSYQTPFIQQYFKTAGSNLPAPSFYNATGRGTPDVSALGTGFLIIQDGQSTPVAGTSASTPTFAAIVSLLNQVRLQAGKPVLGFLNPWIYQVAGSNPNAFYDVTVGSNPQGCCHKGFPCEVGWDPVTGVGTPNYEILKTLV